MTEPLDKVMKHRRAIFFIETAGLLHDIGKLSSAFLDYRRNWQKEKGGWTNDPHENIFFGSPHEPFKGLIPDSFSKTLGEIGNSLFDESSFSIRSAVHGHGGGGGKIMNMLKAADGVDSAIDRNNPLWCNEQKDAIFRSNVFGYEAGRQVSPPEQETARQELYRGLAGVLPQYFDSFLEKDREQILTTIKRAFSQGLADTTRPQNDTTLWEHCYAVTSILKASLAHFVLTGECFEKAEYVRFGILGMGWDGLRFLSFGQKIGDITARREIIETLKRHLTYLIEYEFCLGNEVYSDDNGVYFLVPPNLDVVDGYKGLIARIHFESSEISSGELQPCIAFEPDTAVMTSIVSVIAQLRKMSSAPFFGDVKLYGQTIKKSWEGVKKEATVCPICRLRPATAGKDDQKKICLSCRDRRMLESEKARKKETTPSIATTLYIDDIVDKNRRAALIVATFHLDPWLGGSMIRTLFVSDPQGLQREVDCLGTVEDFKKIEMLLKDSEALREGFTYSRILQDLDAFQNGDEVRAKCVAFLYDRRQELEADKIDPGKINKRWQTLVEKVAIEPGMKQLSLDRNQVLASLLCAKTPTPSTLLDAWNTTHDFNDKVMTGIVEDLLPVNHRLRLQVKEGTTLPDRENNATTKALIEETGEKVEILIFDDNEIEVIGHIISDQEKPAWRRIKIIDKEIPENERISFEIESPGAGTSYRPFRKITASPNLFMAIVPADRAVDISLAAQKAYQERFGKVSGRLSFCVGNVFFPLKMPMFVVIDAGRRLVKSFATATGQHKEMVVTEKMDGAFRLSLNCQTVDESPSLTVFELPKTLGNCTTDLHHPYVLVRGDDAELGKRPSFFKTPAGPVLHIEDVQKDDRLLLYPNLYDFEYLDANTRRHDLGLLSNGRRPSAITGFEAKPLHLEHLEQKFVRLWRGILKNGAIPLTDTKLTNLQSLWLARYREWSEVSVQDGKEAWRRLVETSIKGDLGITDSKIVAFLQETIGNGVFFDALDLFLGILKERIDMIKEVDDSHETL